MLIDLVRITGVTATVSCGGVHFLEVDLQRSTYIVFAFVVLHSRGGPGSWLMHFPYVVLHGCFGFF